MVDATRFEIAYRELDRRMRALAEAEGNVFLPSPEPAGPVHYVFVCMEPSLGRSSAAEVKARVEAGARNFLYSIEDFILHFSIRRYLCQPGQRYHITDVSKGAMSVHQANHDRIARYDRWYPLLEEEIDLVASSGARIYTVGRAVDDFLYRRGFPQPHTRILHYSPQAARARNADIQGCEDRFEAFRDTITIEDLLATVKDVYAESHVPTNFCDETLSRLARRRLTLSQRKLIFSYRVTFESVQL